MALGLGAGLFAPAYANTDSRSPAVAGLDAQSVASFLPTHTNDALVSQMLRMGRTLPPVPAGSTLVSNCNDTGAGSLRAAVNAAVDGDTINMTTLACSKITLTTGAIAVGPNNLAFNGPGVFALEISGNDASRAFWHLGNGTLAFNDLSISHGKKYLNNGDLGNAGGACVFSLGTVSMDTTWTKYCDTGSNGTSTVVRGGAIYAKVGAILTNSIVSDSTAHSSTFEARGGGIYTPGTLILSDSSVTGNAVSSTTGPATGGGVQVGSLRASGTATGATSIKYSSLSDNSAYWGGGAYLTAEATVSHSTISGNSSCRGAGLYFLRGSSATSPSTLLASTVSGNTAACNVSAGLAIFGKDASFQDSTIAFNTSHGAASTKYGAGVRVATVNNVDLQNTIISNNSQVSGSSTLMDDTGGITGAEMTGANNLIRNPALPLPGDTITLTDPMLRALASNGGNTYTHMPNFGSPVINAGNNASGQTRDQRGTGFPRVRGPKADIGSIEFNLSDVIFKNGFD